MGKFLHSKEQAKCLLLVGTPFVILAERMAREDWRPDERYDFMCFNQVKYWLCPDDSTYEEFEFEAGIGSEISKDHKWSDSEVCSELFSMIVKSKAPLKQTIKRFVRDSKSFDACFPFTSKENSLQTMFTIASENHAKAYAKEQNLDFALIERKHTSAHLKAIYESLFYEYYDEKTERLIKKSSEKKRAEIEKDLEELSLNKFLKKYLPAIQLNAYHIIPNRFTELTGFKAWENCFYTKDLGDYQPLPEALEEAKEMVPEFEALIKKGFDEGGGLPSHVKEIFKDEDRNPIAQTEWYKEHAKEAVLELEAELNICQEMTCRAKDLKPTKKLAATIISNNYEDIILQVYEKNRFLREGLTEEELENYDPFGHTVKWCVEVLFRYLQKRRAYLGMPPLYKE